jgi:hypothetical protein
MEQMIACLLAEWKEEMKVDQEKTVARLEAKIEEIKSGQGEIESTVNAMEKKMEACLGKTKVTDVEANLKKKESEVVHREVPKEEAAVKSSGALKKGHRGQNLAAKCCQKPKGQTRQNCGSQKKLTAAGRKMTRCAGMERHKGHGHQGHGRNSVARRAPKGRTGIKRLWKGLECKMRIKGPGTRWQLLLKIRRTSDWFNRKDFGLELMKRAAGRSSGLRKVRDWTLWRGRPPPEQESGTGEVGPLKWKKRLHTE